jgi:hypothetical protein
MLEISAKAACYMLNFVTFGRCKPPGHYLLLKFGRIVFLCAVCIIFHSFSITMSLTMRKLGRLAHAGSRSKLFGVRALSVQSGVVKSDFTVPLPIMPLTEYVLKVDMLP